MRVFLLLTLLVAARGAVTCPMGCDCVQDDKGSIVMCQRENLDYFPYGFPSDTIDIDMAMNDFTELTQTTIPPLYALKILKLDRCQIRVIRDYSFNNTPSLKRLQLEGNDIELIHPDAFYGLEKLELLYLQNNKISSITANVFNDLNLLVLQLENNIISNIGPDSFNNARVDSLYLSHNSLNTLPANALSPLRDSLKNLYISWNKFVLVLDKDIFNGFVFEDLNLSNNNMVDTGFVNYINTRALDLSGNDINFADFQDYSSLLSVEYLYIKNNTIHHMEKDWWKYLSNVKLFDASFNRMSSVQSEWFEYMINLHTLVLNDNSLSTPPYDLAIYAPNLRVLKLARNRISSIQEDYFDKLHLQELDISGNKIQILPESLRGLFDSISNIYLMGNKFHCNCEMAWLRRYIATGRIQDSRDMYCVSPRIFSFLGTSVDEFTCSTPDIIQIPGNITVNEGNEVFLSCVASADPAPEVRWVATFGDVVSITPSANRTIYKTYAIWHMVKIDLYQGGKFSCVASNVEGTAKKELFIFVNSNRTTTTVSTTSTTSTTTTSPTTFTTTTSTTTTLQPVESSTVKSTASSVVTSTQHESPSTVNPYPSTTEVPNRPTVDITVTTATPQFHNDTLSTAKAMENSWEITINRIIIIACVVGGIIIFIVLIICVAKCIVKRKNCGRYGVNRRTTYTSKEHIYFDDGLVQKPCNGNSVL